jgi:hypothetical protein
MNSRTAGLIAAIIFLAIGGGQLYMTFNLSRGTLVEPGPGLFPMFIGILMSTASLFYVVRVLAERHPVDFDLRTNATRIAVLVAAFVAFILLLPRIGFIVPSLLLQVATLRVFGMRGLWRLGALAAATTAASVLIFEILLGVQFPTPSWSF